MSLNIKMTREQALSLRHLIQQCLQMADNSQRVAEILDLNPMDVIRATSIFEKLPKPGPNDRHYNPAKSHMLPAHQAVGARDFDPWILESGSSS